MQKKFRYKLHINFSPLLRCMRNGPTQAEGLAASVQASASPGSNPRLARLAELVTAPKVRALLEGESVIGQPVFVHSKAEGGLHVAVRTLGGKRPLEVVPVDRLAVHSEGNSDGGQAAGKIEA